MIQVKISEIVVEGRTRKLYGDLMPLETSIRQLGLLQPIGITPDKRLLFGGRRLRACKNIGLDVINARIIDIEADDPISALKIEQHENEFRLDFTPSEKVEIATRIQESLAGRQGQRTDLKLPQNFAEVNAEKELVANSPQVESGTKTRDIAAEAVGMKPTMYREAKAVVDSGQQEVIEQMDKGELSIHAAYKQIRQAEPSLTFKITLKQSPGDDAGAILAKAGKDYAVKLAVALLEASGQKVEVQK